MIPTKYMIDTESTPYVVVYGTLKKGYSNHRLLEAADLIGVAQIYGDRILNDTWPPTFTYTEGNKTPFEGELYKVTAEELRRLDGLEGHPNGWYRTQVDAVSDMGNGVTDIVRAWCYFYYVDQGHPACPVENGSYIWREGE